MTNLQDFYKLPTEGDIPGFFVMSTAPVNVDDIDDNALPHHQDDLKSIERDELVSTIVEKVIERAKSTDTDQDKAIDLVIAIHGYNTSLKSVKVWYQEILNQVNENSIITPHAVFIGYRWSSESMFSNFSTLLDSLPVGIFPFPQIASVIISLLAGLLLTGLIYLLSFKAIGIICIAAIISITIFYLRKPISEAWYKDVIALLGAVLAVPFILLFPKIYLLIFSLPIDDLPQNSSWLLRIGLSGAWLLQWFLLLSIPTFGLMLLRLSAYPRDSFRATQFAVPDLVDLFSNLDGEIIKKLECHSELYDEQKYLKDKYRIKLSFICHSMGAFVTTGTVRILSDVFDRSSPKNSGANVGHIFCLKRLILVSPDIADLALSANRANYLKSSLRRFEESYLFSNQGDMALLFASTAANYFSFPTRSRFSGRRLGNLGIYADKNQKKDAVLGIVNLNKLQTTPSEKLEHFINENHLQTYLEFNVDYNKAPMHNKGKSSLSLGIVDLFTYFDCTDFQGNEGKEIMSFPLSPQPLRRFGQELRLLWVWLVSKSIDVHGGYFDYKTTRYYIYNLAFGGFRCLLDALKSQSEQENELDKLNKHLETHGIRVALSPERYLVDIKGKKFTDVRREILSNT